MIGRLVGKLIEKNPPYLLIDVNGVGYEVSVPMTTLYQLPELNQAVALYIHMVVREDAQLLYGFVNQHDRRLFRQLIKVNGVGAKIALAIMSGMDTASLIECVLSADSPMLSRIPGIGKKTAERLIIEMQDKLKEWSNEPSGLSDSSASTLSITNMTLSADKDAIEALIALGYKAHEATKVIKKIAQQSPDLPSDQLIKLALQKMVVS